MRLLENARILACDRMMSEYQFMLIDKGRITYIGSELPDIYSQISHRVDMKERVIIPAMADTHIHFGSFAHFEFGLNLKNARNFEQIGSLFKEYEEKNRGGDFIFGFGVSAHLLEEKRLPNRADLDRITGTPLLIEQYDGHAAIANSALIALLDEEVLQAPGFDEASGLMVQNSHQKMINYAATRVKPFSMLSSLALAADLLAQNGIGLLHAAEGNGAASDSDFDMVVRMGRVLPLNFRFFMQTMDETKVIKRKLPRIGGCFEAALDGCFGSQDAALRSPYANNPQNSGQLFYSQEQVNEFAIRANRAGLQVALHAVGDAAVEQALNAYETALADHPRKNHRHIIIHAHLLPEDLLEKAANMEICLSVHPAKLHWPEEPMDYLEEILGSRSDELIPLRSMLDAGLIIGGGSDAPCTFPSPIQGMWAACNHPNPGLSITAHEALAMYTRYAAYLSFDEREMGSLERGKWANFAVLSHDLTNVAAASIKDVRVLGLFMKGQRYQKQGGAHLSLLLKSYYSNSKDKV